MANVTFDKQIHDFGIIKEGDEVGARFVVLNIGECPWIVNNIETTCGCTLVEMDRKPLSPGDSIVIRLYFNTDGRSGNQFKPITIFDNSLKGKQELLLTAIVE